MKNLEILRGLENDLAKTLYVKSGLMNVDLKTIKKIKMTSTLFDELFCDLIENEKLTIEVEILECYNTEHNLGHVYKEGKHIKSYYIGDDGFPFIKLKTYDDAGNMIQEKYEDCVYNYTYNIFGDVTSQIKTFNRSGQTEECLWDYEYYPNTNKKKSVSVNSRVGHVFIEYDENGNEILLKHSREGDKDVKIERKKYDINNNIIEKQVITKDNIETSTYSYNQNGHLIQSVYDTIYKNRHTIITDNVEYLYYPDGKTIKSKKETRDCGTYIIEDYDMQGNCIRTSYSNGRVYVHDIEMIGDVFYRNIEISKNSFYLHIVE